MHRHEAPGWYGKLAALGDFASRRLEHDWVQACDRWLSDCVSSSQAQLGEHWLQAYLSAPVWRFAWAPGVVGPHWWFGVLMPSCDNVGRYFPLVIAHPRTQPPLDRIGLDHLDLWWSHMARAALDTLLEGHSLQAFEAHLARGATVAQCRPHANHGTGLCGAGRRRRAWPPSSAAWRHVG
jgi:type VI secretion system protein ImpM